MRFKTLQVFGSVLQRHLLSQSRRIQGSPCSLLGVVIVDLAFGAVLDRARPSCARLLIPKRTEHFFFDICFVLLPGDSLDDATENQVAKVRVGVARAGVEVERLAIM